MKALSANLDVNPHLIAQKLCSRIYNGVSTSELDILGAEICATMITVHPDYQIIAGRISMSNLEKNTSPSFSETIQILYDWFGSSVICTFIQDNALDFQSVAI